MVLEKDRKETPFETRDNMLDLWKHVTELCYRRLGIKKRKLRKIPSNFNLWSEEQQKNYIADSNRILAQQEKMDELFIQDETHVLIDLCRKITYLIDGANSFNPQYIFEYNKQRSMQDDAISLCHNLKRELNHVADVIPSNKNFLAILTEEVDKEIQLLRGWRTSCVKNRKEILLKEIRQSVEIAKKADITINETGMYNTLAKILDIK